jgi:hypothetical protein
MPGGDPRENSLGIHTNSEKAQLVVVMPIKPTLVELVKKLDLPDFKVSIDRDGHYSFEIGGVPLRLEDLRETSEAKTT